MIVCPGMLAKQKHILTTAVCVYIVPRPGATATQPSRASSPAAQPRIVPRILTRTPLRRPSSLRSLSSHSSSASKLTCSWVQ